MYIDFTKYFSWILSFDLTEKWFLVIIVLFHYISKTITSMSVVYKPQRHKMLPNTNTFGMRINDRTRIAKITQKVHKVKERPLLE